ncbi:MAG TPA: ATP-binding protein [Bryobacteraceae bacterium]|jgi:light-regulated signal transduction histidine kinase (bacteriophytochrome)|nr:ATP-binding protein [Bryobacteraceae bacterium]
MEWTPVTPQAEPDRQAVIEAQTLLSALIEFSQRAGHDLLGPLSQAASLLALYVRRHKDQAGDDGNELLEYLLTASARMDGLVGGIRKYMDAAGRRPNVDTVDLNYTVAAAKAAIGASLSASGAAIQTEALPAVKADATQMQTVFEAVIGNAIKFHKPETAPLVRISGRREGALAVIAVEDNGIGIEPENRDAVFLPFKRLNGREYPGQGLGLALAKLIVAMNGGAIGVMESATGTRIEFTVPAP